MQGDSYILICDAVKRTLVHHVPFELVAWEIPVWEGFVTGMARDLVMRQIYGNGVRVAPRPIFLKAYVVY